LFGYCLWHGDRAAKHKSKAMGMKAIAQIIDKHLTHYVVIHILYHVICLSHTTAVRKKEEKIIDHY
jgi:predicted acetyltransferase